MVHARQPLIHSFSAVFSRSVKGEKRQYRKQGKYCSHGAEEPAKESFLYTHASHQKEQDHKTDPISSQTEVPCVDHGKYIPRAGSLCFSIYSRITQKDNQQQYQIFHIPKIQTAFSGIFTGFFFRFLHTFVYSACSASPNAPNAQTNPQKNLPNTIV